MYGGCIAYASSYAKTYADGNSDADAEFYAAAICAVYAEANAHSCACVKASGDVDLDAKAGTGYKMVYELEAKLRQATLTYAVANTIAGAIALAGAEGQVYSSTNDEYCAGPGKHKPPCDETEAKVVAVASAGALGHADAFAKSGSDSSVYGKMIASGKDVDSIEATFIAVAHSWAFSQAAAEAIAGALTIVFADAEAVQSSG